MGGRVRAEGDKVMEKDCSASTAYGITVVMTACPNQIIRWAAFWPIEPREERTVAPMTPIKVYNVSVILLVTTFLNLTLILDLEPLAWIKKQINRTDPQSKLVSPRHASPAKIALSVTLKPSSF